MQALTALPLLFIAAFAASDAGAANEAATVLHGAGATFPALLYKAWVDAYRSVDPSTTIEYNGVGSGEGVKQFLNDEVDFGASDAAMTDEQIATARDGAQLIPATAGLVALIYNLPEMRAPLKLSRAGYVGILSGRIRTWSDPAIRTTNPGAPLPDRQIILVARQDGSGTTFALTNHLSAISADWRDRGPGAHTLIAWPDNAMLVRGNEGVASRVKMSIGAIGYVEYAYARRLSLPTASLENRAGNFVAPSAEVGEATLVENLAQIPPNLRLFLPDPEGADAYPIVTLSWLLLRHRYTDDAKREALKRFVAWGLDEGQHLGVELGYVPLPAAMSAAAKTSLANVQ